MLSARELKVFYGVIQGLKGVDIDIHDREIVTLIGSNGAGKTSTLNGIVNLVRSTGRVNFLNEDISRSQTHQIVRKGLALVPEGRRIFTNLTIEENLRMGGLQQPRRLSPPARSHVQSVSPAERAAYPDGGDHERRRAADAGDRQSVDERAGTADAR